MARDHTRSPGPVRIRRGTSSRTRVSGEPDSTWHQPWMARTKLPRPVSVAGQVWSRVDLKHRFSRRSTKRVPNVRSSTDERPFARKVDARSRRVLLVQHPTLASEFVRCVTQPDRTPASIRPSSNLRCEWRCPNCRSEYEAQPGSRIRGRGCPSCSRVRAGDNRSAAPIAESLVTLRPWIAAEFVGLVGRPHRTASDISPGSNLTALWRCTSCSLEWEAVVASRAIGGHGCPSCARARTAAARMSPFPASRSRTDSRWWQRNSLRTSRTPAEHRRNSDPPPTIAVAGEGFAITSGLIASRIAPASVAAARSAIATHDVRASGP